MFVESHYLKPKLKVHSNVVQGCMLTSPTFEYALEQLPFAFRKVSAEEIRGYISYLFEVLPISHECILISFIYLERLIRKEIIQICEENWRPLVFTSLLVAIKFFEDVR